VIQLALSASRLFERFSGVSHLPPVTPLGARKRKDKAFRARLRTVMERDREILERLAR